MYICRLIGRYNDSFAFKSSNKLILINLELINQLKYVGAAASLWKSPCFPAILNTVAETDIAFLPNCVKFVDTDPSHMY